MVGATISGSPTAPERRRGDTPERGDPMFPLEKLLTVPEEARDAGWVIEALQEAVELEFGTIPPYLYARWSIDPDADPGQVGDAIMHVAQEEMLHMGLAGNLLAGRGAK